MGKEEELKFVEGMLTFWQLRISNQKAFDFLDMTRTAQDLTCKILNEIYDLELINLDKEKKNTEGIDLGDKKTGVAYQVTTISPKDAAEKIEKNLAAFQDLHRQDYPQEIRFLFLNPEMPCFTPTKKEKFARICPGFDADSHVLGVKDLLKAIDLVYDTDEERFRRVKKILQRETGFVYSEGMGTNDGGWADVSNMLREGSLAYYRALRGPTGRFRFLSISEIILPGSRHTWLDTGAEVDSPNEKDANQKFLGGISDESRSEIRVNAAERSSLPGGSSSKVPLVIDALPGLWQEEIRHAVVVGPGGMGKTVSLLKWWEKLLTPAPGNGAESAMSSIPVFIALNELNQLEEGERKDFILSYIVKHYAQGHSGASGSVPTKEQVRAFMKRPLAQGESFVPAVVLLLDGFNEITVEKKDLLVELKNLIEQCPGLQVVLTSRFDMRANFNWCHWHRVELLELKEEDIEKYLLEKGAALTGPDDKQSRLRTLIANPMMLTLYAAACEVRENHKDSPHCSFKEQVETPGELLWNFMEAQVALLPERYAEDEQQVVYYTFLLKYFLPGLGFAMEKVGLFDFTEQQLIEQMEALCFRFGRDDFFDTFFEFAGEEDHLPVYEEEKIEVKEKRKIAKKLIKNLCGEFSMLVQEGQSYRFLHQNFRDFFAAVHILNECEIALKKEEIPALLKESTLDFFVRRFMGEIEGEHYAVPYVVDNEGWQIDIDKENLLHRVIDLCRGKFGSVVGSAVDNIVQIWKEVRGELSGADLSHLDLSRIMLNGVRCSRFYRDRKVYLAASLTGARVYERSLFFQGHTFDVLSAVYSRDGKKILSASADLTVKEWATDTGLCIRTFAGHSEAVYSAVYSPDGQKILSASMDHTVKEWNVTSGECIRTLTGHSDKATSAVYSPDGKKILSISEDSTIKEWDVTSGRCLLTLTGHSQAASSAVYSPDGKKILSASNDKTIKEWDVSTGLCIRTLTGHSFGVTSAMYNQDGGKILSASWGKTIKEWDVATGKCILTLIGHSQAVFSAVYSRDEKRILSASMDHAIKEWDATTGECIRTQTGYSDAVRSAIYRPMGKKILSASRDNTIKEWDVATGLCIRTLTGHSGWVNSAVYSRDGQKILSASKDHTIKEWETATGLCIRTLTVYSGWVNSAVYSQGGKKILSASWDNIKEWDVATGVCIRTLEEHSDEVTSAVYSQDGKKILSASEDHTIKEWDVDTGACIRTLEEHSYGVTSVLYSQDGKKILSSSRDNTIKEWDAATGHCIGTWKDSDKAAAAKRAEYAGDQRNIKLMAVENKIHFEDREFVNIPGLWFQGCSFRNLEKGSVISAENRKLLKQYGAILD